MELNLRQPILYLQYWPSVAVGQNGDIAILFYDTRNTPNNSVIEAFIAKSTDGGITFTNELVSSEQSPTNIPNGDVRFGDYIQLLSRCRRNLVC